MATSQHYMIKADGSKRYLSCNPELALQHNWNTAVDRLAASMARTEEQAYLEPLNAVDDSDTAYKGAQWALGISLVGLVGLAAWAILSL